MQKAIRIVLLLFVCFGVTEARAFAAPKADPPQLIDARAFLKELMESNYDQAVSNFDKTLAKSLSAQQLGDAWKQVLASAGSFQKVLDYTLAKQDKMNIVELRCAFDNGNLVLRLVFDSDRKISGVFFHPDQKR